MLACSFFCYQISLAIDTSIITLKKFFSTFFELLEQKSVKSNTIYYKRKKETKKMEVLIIKDNKKVMDLNTKRLGTLLKIFLTTITVDTSIIALVKLITILN